MFEDRPVCDRCGRRILYPKHHGAICDLDSPFDGICPMCEQPYEGYLDHLAECPGKPVSPPQRTF